MRRRFADNAVFFRECVRSFHHTGAVLPSGRFLASALSRFVAAPLHGGPQKILEVGPGTGAVTRSIITGMGEADSLDLVELNDTFVRQLQDRFEREPAFQAVADRARVLHCPIEELPRNGTYDVIVSGLPLNNFSVSTVERILRSLFGRLASGGILSFFEYIAVRRARAMVSSRSQRERLRGISRAMHAVLDPHEIRCDAVWLNVPPAWVHHVRR
jgi:phosphatidylethanolamine/phosphatidyl-N-methylethanolamine N-methyltransferase